VLPPGVVVAESPALAANTGQGGLVASAARARRSRGNLDEGKRPYWATVNICDTKASPNALGVRTSVPGNGSDQRIYARYTAQWWSGAAQEWKTVGGAGVTDWIYMGQADVTAQQAGWTFRFVQPPAGTTYVMRGVVEVEWRDSARAAQRKARKARARKARNAHRLRKSRKARHARNTRGRRTKGVRRNARASQRVVRERTLLTRTGMTGVQGGDPAGLSKAMCLIW
jgi:hypothetical protein